MRILVWCREVSIGGGTRVLNNLIPAIARQEDIELIRLVVPSSMYAKLSIETSSYPNLQVTKCDDPIDSPSAHAFVQESHVVYFFWPHTFDYRPIPRPTVCTIQDLTILEFVPPNILGSFMRTYWESLDLWLKNTTMIAVAANDITRKLVGLFGEHCSSAVTIPFAISPIDPNLDYTLRPEIASRLPGRYIVYPSNTSPHKNHYNLFIAYSRFALRKSVPLVLVGQYTEQLRVQLPEWPEIPYLSTLVSLIRRKKLEIDKDLYPLGFVADQDVLPIIKNAQALIMPSLSEGGGLPIYEALRLGVPVLCSDIPVFREHLKSHGHSATVGWFDPESPDSILSALNHLFNHYDAYRCAVTKGKNPHSETWDDVARKYIHLMRLAYLKYHDMIKP